MRLTVGISWCGVVKTAAMVMPCGMSHIGCVMCPEIGRLCRICEATVVKVAWSSCCVVRLTAGSVRACPQHSLAGLVDIHIAAMAAHLVPSAAMNEIIVDCFWHLYHWPDACYIDSSAVLSCPRMYRCARGATSEQSSSSVLMGDAVRNKRLQLARNITLW